MTHFLATSHLPRQSRRIAPRLSTAWSLGLAPRTLLYCGSPLTISAAKRGTERQCSRGPPEWPRGRLPSAVSAAPGSGSYNRGTRSPTLRRLREAHPYEQLPTPPAAACATGPTFGLSLGFDDMCKKSGGVRARTLSDGAALPPPDHASTEAEIVFLVSVHVSAPNADGVVVVEVPVRFNTFVERPALDVRREGGAECPARLFAHMPGKQAVMRIATRAANTTHKTSSLERGTYTWLSKAACERTDRGRLWMLARVLELPGAAMGGPLFADLIISRSTDACPPSTGLSWSLNRGWRPGLGVDS